MIKLTDILKELQTPAFDNLKRDLMLTAGSWDKSGRKAVAKDILTYIEDNQINNIADAIAYIKTLKYSAKEYVKAIYVASLIQRYEEQAND